MSIQRKVTRPILPVALLLCGTFFSHAAFAQVQAAPGAASPDDSEVGAVIVTARKQAENVQRIPESITAIDARTIREAHLTTLDDFNSLVTNLNIVQRADNTPDVVLRGVGTFGVVQGVGFYVNDVQQFEGQTVRPEDIDRIEVLKGPQGTLFGGSNVGGAIKYVTMLPSETFSGEASVEYGAYNDTTVDAAVSGAIVPQHLLARLSVFNETTDGFQFDPIFGRNIGKSSEVGGRLTLEYLGDQTKVLFYLSADHVNSENMNLYYTPPNDHTYLRTYNGGVDGTLPSYKRDFYAPTLEISHDFGSVLLTSITSYFHSSIDSVGNLDKGALPLFGDLIGDPTNPLASYKTFVNYPQDFRKTVGSQEVRLSSNGTSPFRWLVGAFMQQIDTNTLQIQDVGVAPTIGSPVGEVFIANSVLANHHVNRDYALFGNASYDVDNWTFEAGLRVAYFHNTMTDTTSACGPCSGTVNEVDVLPKGSIDYHFSKDVMAYFTVARGDEEGDLADNPAAVDEVQPFKTEFALSYEGGLKSSLFDHRLNLNLAAFYIDYRNRIFEVGRFTGAGLFTFEQNVGSSKNYGFEVEAVAHPTRELALTGGVGVTRAIFGQVIFVDGFGNPVNANGNQAPDTPEYQATLAVDWRHHLSDDLVLGARVDTRFVGRSFWDAAGCSALSPGCPSQGFRFQQRPYEVVNAGVSLDIGRHWSIGAHIENLFDVRYNTFYADASETGAPYNVAGINRPRQWFVNLTARY
jgi:iron complex outermembrane receptor protein